MPRKEGGIMIRIRGRGGRVLRHFFGPREKQLVIITPIVMNGIGEKTEEERKEGRGESFK